MRQEEPLGNINHHLSKPSKSDSSTSSSTAHIPEETYPNFQGLLQRSGSCDWFWNAERAALGPQGKDSTRCHLILATATSNEARECCRELAGESKEPASIHPFNAYHRHRAAKRARGSEKSEGYNAHKPFGFILFQLWNCYWPAMSFFSSFWLLLESRWRMSCSSLVHTWGKEGNEGLGRASRGKDVTAWPVSEPWTTVQAV